MPTSTTPALELVQAYGAAWNARDAEACGAMFAEDGVREWMVKPIAGDTRFEGRTAVIEGIAGFMAVLPDIAVEVRDAWVIESGAVLEWRVTGTHRVDWASWTAQGERVDFPGVSVYLITDGLFTLERMYWDTGLMTAEWRPPTG